MAKPRLKYCKQCGRDIHHRRRRIRPKVGFVLTIVTCGLFLPVWLLYGKWVCMECGATHRA